MQATSWWGGSVPLGRTRWRSQVADGEPQDVRDTVTDGFGRAFHVSGMGNAASVARARVVHRHEHAEQRGGWG